MSKLTRTLIIGATLAAMHLAGMTAVAQAQANDEPVTATAHRTPSRGVLAPPPGRLAGADRRGRRPPAGAGPRALLHPQRNTRPDAGPSARPNRADSPAGSSLPSVCCCRPGAGRWAGRAGRQAGRPPRSGRARGLTSPPVTPSMGLPRPPGGPITTPRQPPHISRLQMAGYPRPKPPDQRLLPPVREPMLTSEGLPPARARSSPRQPNRDAGRSGKRLIRATAQLGPAVRRPARSPDRHRQFDHLPGTAKPQQPSRPSARTKGAAMKVHRRRILTPSPPSGRSSVRH